MENYHKIFPLSNTQHSQKSYDWTRQNNNAMLYRLIEQQAPISRIQLSYLSQLAPASVTKICRQLLANKLIKEIEHQPSTGGRRAISLVVEQQYWLTFLISLEQNQLTLGVMDLTGKVLAQKSTILIEFNNLLTLEQEIGVTVQKFYQQVKAEYTTHQFLAAALVINGVVDEQSSLVYQLPNLPLTSPWDPRVCLAKILDVPIYLGHNIRSLALAECYLGEAQSCNDMLFLRIHHTQVGAGIVLNHQLFVGHQYTAGELGHIQVEPEGKRCLCGNIGCLETVVSNQAIEQQMQSLLEQQSQFKQQAYNISQICQVIEQDHIAKQLINYVGEQIGRVLAMSVNIFNPEKIVISGEITQAQGVLFPAIQQALSDYALPNLAEKTLIVASKLKNENLIGGFALIKRALWEGELLQKCLKN